MSRDKPISGPGVGVTDALRGVLEEIRAGRTFRAWAADLGVSHNAPYHWLHPTRPRLPGARSLGALLREATPAQREVLLRELEDMEPAGFALDAGRQPMSFACCFAPSPAQPKP